jgi:hypothetical protein
VDIKAAGILGACIVVAALLIAFLGPDDTQSSSAAGGDNGRYQVATTTESNVFILDTRTGRLWHRSGERQWAEEKTPWRTKGGK